MATVVNVTYTTYQQIRSSQDNNIIEYRDFSANGLPSSPSNTNNYLAATTGSGITARKLCVYYSGTYYCCDPPEGLIFSDGTNLYQIKSDATILVLSSSIYDSSYPITYSSYTSSSLTSTIASYAMGIGLNTVTGLSTSNSAIIGNINTGDLTLSVEGVFSIHFDITGAGALLPSIQIYNSTSSKMLANGSAILTGQGVACNYIGKLAASDVILFRTNSTLGGTVSVNINVTRIN